MKQLKSWLSGLVAVCMLGALLPASGAAADPTETIELRKVTGADTVEISILAAVDSFMAAQAVLEYNSEKLYPVHWGAAGGAVTVREGAGWQDAVSAKTMAPGGVAGKPSLVYQTAEHKGYLYLGAESLTDPLSDEDAQDGAVVTVRFRLTAEAAAEAEADEQALLGWVGLAPDDICVSAPPGFCGSVTTAEGKTFVYAADPAGLDQRFTPMAAPALKAVKGASRYADAKLEPGDYTVTFFDWDGKVIDAISTKQDARENVDKITTEWKKPGGCLSGKKGYDFYGWLRVYQESRALKTAGGTFVAAAAAADYQTEAARADFADFSDLERNIIVQAAYVENEACNSAVDDATKIYYTVSDPVYNRYGTANETEGKYSITYTVKRENSAGAGVTKLEEPAVYVVMKPKNNGQFVVTKIDLQNADETTFEVVPTKAMESVDVTVINTKGYASWPQSPARSDVTSARNADFVREGTVAYLRDQAIVKLASPDKETEWDQFVDETAFRDAGLSVSGVSAAKENILNAMRGLTEAQRKAVTAADLQKMINNAYSPPAL
ncbi:MAG: hypothetical protein Q4C72_01010 [Eubacteriales bacterium]|nr:hypothetical protein [Eubacteriales bacterium]